MPKSVKGVMDEWKAGELHSGSKHGPVVTNQKQAVAIALSEQRQKKAKGKAKRSPDVESHGALKHKPGGVY